VYVVVYKGITFRIYDDILVGEEVKWSGVYFGEVTQSSSGNSAAMEDQTAKTNWVAVDGSLVLAVE